MIRDRLVLLAAGVQGIPQRALVFGFALLRVTPLHLGDILLWPLPPPLHLGDILL